MNAIIQNQSLKAYNTFGIEVNASYFSGFKTIESLSEVLDSAIFQQNKHLILGGGSNILFTKDFDGILLSIECLFRSLGISPSQKSLNHVDIICVGICIIHIYILSLCVCVRGYIFY